MVAGDAVITVDVGFGAVANLHARAAIVTDHVLRSLSNAVAAIQGQVAGDDGDSEPPIVGDGGSGDVTVHIEGAAADLESGTRAVLDGAIGDVDQRVIAGEADAAAVLNGDGVEIHAGIANDQNALAAIEGEVLDEDSLGAMNGEQLPVGVAGNYCRSWIAKNEEVRATQHRDILVTGAGHWNGIGTSGLS